MVDLNQHKNSIKLQLQAPADMLEEEVANVPFEELEKAKAEGDAAFRPRLKSAADTKRANKNMPMEISSKKPVGRFRQVIQVPKQVSRDPRFESLCGNFKETSFKKHYSFMFDENLPNERQSICKQLKKEKNPDVIDELNKQLSWIDHQLKSETERRKLAARAAEHQKKESVSVKEGKKPYYLTKSKKRKMELTEKYKELKESGKLEAFLAKRRKKNAAKDHRYVPYRRPQDQHS